MKDRARRTRTRERQGGTEQTELRHELAERAREEEGGFVWRGSQAVGVGGVEREGGEHWEMSWVER